MGEKKHETESEGEKCRLYIYSGKNCSERIDDPEVEKGSKREREREKKGRKDRKEAAEEHTAYGATFRHGGTGGAVREEQSRPVNESMLFYTEGYRSIDVLSRYIDIITQLVYIHSSYMLLLLYTYPWLHNSTYMMQCGISF